MGLVSSVRWVAVSQAARVVSQLVSVAVLARLLPPASYGVMAMAMTVTNLAYLFRDLGMGAAIIQRKQVADDLLCAIYWLNVCLAFGLAVLLAALAVPVAHLYQEPQLAAILATLALAFPLSSFGTVQGALLERESQFRTMARIEIISAIGSLGLAITLALAGAGVWSLVGQMLLATALTALQLSLATAWRPRAVFPFKALREVAGFGAHLSLFQGLVYLERNADGMIIGRLLGSAALGLYAMAYKVMLFPLQNITGAASRALLPAMSRRQGSLPEVARLYLRATSTIAMVTAPMMAGLYYLREPFVLLALGPRWVAMAGLLKWLAVVGFVQSITASTGAVFVSLGKSRLLLSLGLYGTVLQVGSFLVGVRWGIEGVAASYCVANLLNILPVSCLATSLLEVAPRVAIMAVGKPMAAAAAMLLYLWILDGMLAPHALSMAAKFSISVASGAAVYGFVLFVLLQQDASAMRALLKFG
jgi:O-antigen/teichoic acid export membrane protein